MSTEETVAATNDAKKPQTLREQVVTQITITEDEFEEAKAHVSRCDGALAAMRHTLTLIDDSEKAAG